MHVFLVHFCHKQAHRTHHHDRVAGLDGYDNVAELLTLADAQELHTALYDALRSVSVARHDAVGERTVVHSDAYGGVVVVANAQERHKTLVYLAKFGGIFFVGIFKVLERAGRVYVVAGVYPHFLSVQGGHVGHVGIEVYVGH